MRRWGHREAMCGAFTLAVCTLLLGGENAFKKPSAASPAAAAGEPCREGAPSVEYALGSAMARRYLAESIPWAKSRVTEYIGTLGQCLAKASGTQRTFIFQVVYSPRPNALSLPGGFIFVNSGALESAESEDEVAGLLAREIARVNACLWRTPLPGPTPPAPTWVSLFHLEPQLGGSPMRFTCTSSCHGDKARRTPSQECEATRLATTYLARAGYDPCAVGRIMDRMQDFRTPDSATRKDREARRQQVCQVARELQFWVSSPAVGLLLQRDRQAFQRARAEARVYDELYLRLIGGPAPGMGGQPPRLVRRGAKPAAKRPAP